MDQVGQIRRSTIVDGLDILKNSEGDSVKLLKNWGNVVNGGSFRDDTSS